MDRSFSDPNFSEICDLRRERDEARAEAERLRDSFRLLREYCVESSASVSKQDELNRGSESELRLHVKRTVYHHVVEMIDTFFSYQIGKEAKP